MLDKSFDYTKSDIFMAFYTNLVMKESNTFVLQEGSFGHFVSLSINLKAARVKIIDSISSVSYADDELRLLIIELHRTIMMKNKIGTQKVLNGPFWIFF
jgi:hypothetical protein